jgi:hypothetical protein
MNQSRIVAVGCPALEVGHRSFCSRGSRGATQRRNCSLTWVVGWRALVGTECISMRRRPPTKLCGQRRSPPEKKRSPNSPRPPRRTGGNSSSPHRRSAKPYAAAKTKFVHANEHRRAPNAEIHRFNPSGPPVRRTSGRSMRRPRHEHSFTAPGINSANPRGPRRSSSAGGRRWNYDRHHGSRLRWGLVLRGDIVAQINVMMRLRGIMLAQKRRSN